MSDQQQKPAPPEGKEEKTKKSIWKKVLRTLLFTILGDRKSTRLNSSH